MDSAIQKLIRDRVEKEGLDTDRAMNVKKKFNLTLDVGDGDGDNNKSFSERFLEERVKESKGSNNEEAPIKQKQEPNEPNEDDLAESSRGLTIRTEQSKGGKKKTKKRKSSKKKTKKRKGKRKSGKKK